MSATANEPAKTDAPSVLSEGASVRAQAIAEGTLDSRIEAEISGLVALPPLAERERLEAEVEKRMSGSLLRLRTRAPFFATLALFARIRVRYDLPTAATDGRDVFWNPYFLQTLSPGEADAVLLHEVLHAALLHVVRRGTREPIFGISPAILSSTA